MNRVSISNQRILDRNNYSKKTLDTFEIVAAYFIDVYYNHLFIEAKHLYTKGSVESLTEGYKHSLNAFLQGIDNPKAYTKTLSSIHSFFTASQNTNISFSECIERITSEFIPKDFYKSVNKQQKTSILKMVIGQSNRVFVEKMVRDGGLNMVIDAHNDVDNIRIFQDEFIDMLIFERESVYHRFISTQVKTKSGGAHTSSAMVESMQNEIKILCNEKFTLKKLITSLKKIIVKSNADITEANTEITILKNGIMELKNELNTSQLELVKTKQKLEIYSSKPEAALIANKKLAKDAIDAITNSDLQLEAVTSNLRGATKINTINNSYTNRVPGMNTNSIMDDNSIMDNSTVEYNKGVYNTKQVRFAEKSNIEDDFLKEDDFSNEAEFEMVAELEPDKSIYSISSTVNSDFDNRGGNTITNNESAKNLLNLDENDLFSETF
jgi:hypothetical protein